MPPQRTLSLLFALFAVSGFTGLVYESMWSHYLKLFLGAAAFAQSFVLGAFMGGMALGAWLVSRVAARIQRPLLAYAALEALIGIAALGFHDIYVALTALSFDRVFPALASPTAVEVYKYALCAALIVPQTVLLGMTFPLMSTAIVRREPAQSGHHLAMLYFTNSLGAALGALATAFVLLGWLGMPGTMRLAGTLNLALAGAVAFLADRERRDLLPPLARAAVAERSRALTRLFLAGAFVTGASSFIYEIAWIRMLSLVLGASFQAFELMLSAFITGLALGGLWIRKRIDTLHDPVRYAGLIQLAMGLCALGTIFVYHQTFDWMAWALSVLQRTDQAYLLFNLFSHGIAFAVMLPATFFAGMTLPLFTHVLIRNGSGERAIGQVYAANTVGAIVGVLLAVHVFVPDTGVKLTLVLGAAADILLGGWLLRSCGSAFRRAQAFAAIIVGMVAATATARAEVLSPERLASGVFRHGQVQKSETRTSYYRDGKTASVAINSTESVVSIITNGKPDAAVELDIKQPPTQDEYTMTLLGALPMLINPNATRIAAIGWGSGLTTEVILSHGGPRRVDTIEIEPVMVSGARSFFPRVIRPYRDPRSHVVFEDAKTYFSRHREQYDAIVSEPSNPWVNGVASLFTKEFYRDTRRYMAPGALFVQWLQLYEMNDTLLASVLRAMDENFSDYEIYEANPGDVVVVAVMEGKVPPILSLPDKHDVFLQQLKRVRITSAEDVAARSIGHKHQLSSLARLFAVAPNSDFDPILQLGATRARFARTSASALLELSAAPVPVLEMAAGGVSRYLVHPIAREVTSIRLQTQSTALNIANGLLDKSADPLRFVDPVVQGVLLTLKRPYALCGVSPSKVALEQLHRAAELTLSHLEPSRQRALWEDQRWLSCPTGMSRLVSERLGIYRAISSRNADAMLSRARTLLQTGPGDGGDRWGRFLLATAMLGARASGNDSETERLWREYGVLLYRTEIPPVHLSYLRQVSPD